MTIFAVTGKMLENIQPKPYYNEILNIFTLSTNGYKVALDTTDIIIEIYTKIGFHNSLIAAWLQVMSHEPKNFEPIESVKLDNPKCACEIFLLIASKIAGSKKILTHSIQDLKDYKFTQPKIIKYNNVEVILYDRDDALIEFREYMSQNHKGSGDNVAGDKYEMILPKEEK